MRIINNGILSNIGHTPLIKLSKVYEQLNLDLYAKLEMYNPGGSIKDRPAVKMVTDALSAGNIDQNSTIIESSSGNMAIGLAQVCRYYGLKLIVVIDPKINSHTLKILKTYGAGIEKVIVPDEDGNYLNARLQRVQELLDKLPGGYWPNQYGNKANPASHHQTMGEIVGVLPRPPDYLFTSTSTCGTIMGCAEYAQNHSLKTKIVAVDAIGSVIFGTSAAERLVPGHGAGRSSDLLKKNLIDHVIHISDQECIEGCYRLLEREAILAGGSSGAVISAVKKFAPDISEKASCALILPDCGERYLDTIYNEDWLKMHFGENNPSIPLASTTDIKNEPSADAKKNLYLESKIVEKLEPHKVAIIGGGPKGMYGFERLAALLKAHPVERKVEIHVYDKSAHFGAGEIYNTVQPDYMLINNPIGDINMWIDEKPEPVTPQYLSLTEWLQKYKCLDVTENDYVSRALVGQYMENGFEAIANHLPEGVSGKYFAGEVLDICKEGEGYSVQIKNGAADPQKIPHKYHHILMATGHPRKKLSAEEKAFEQFAQHFDDRGFIPFIYPVEKNLREISPGSSIAIKGIGLTFIDAVLALTEGRNGTFERNNKNGKLRYSPSGAEPGIIYPFSRSGLPMIPRDPNSQNTTPLKFFTESTLARLKAASPDKKLDFKLQILPLIYREMEYVFYNIQMKSLGFKDDLHACATYKEVQHYINLFHEHHFDIEPFHPESFLKPLNRQHFQGDCSFNSKITNYLHFFLDEAQKGEFDSSWAAVSAVWRKATPLFAKLYAFGGLKPLSQLFFDTAFRRLLNRVTFGPPIKSVEKILALMDAGIIDFSMAQNPVVKLNKKNAAFILHQAPNDFQTVSYLIDARIPNISIENDQTALYRNIKKRGLFKQFTNEHSGNAYQPGCIALSREGYAINESGNIEPAIAITGTPTEGVTFDNDTLSRNRNNFVSKWAADIREYCARSLVKCETS